MTLDSLGESITLFTIFVYDRKSPFMSMKWLKALLPSLFLLIGLSGFAQLSGTYTINPSGSGSKNYQTFGAAVDSLNANGISSSVVFEVSDGNYNEQIELKYVSGSSSSKTITFKGGDSSKVRLYYNCSRYDAVVKINAANYFRFEGMTIETTNSSYGYSVQVSGGSENIRIESCILKAPSRSSGIGADCAPLNVSGTAYNSYGNNGEDIHLKHCILTGGYFGINARGTNNGLLSSTIEADSCEFTGQSYYAVYAEFFNDVSITNSTIENLQLYYGYGILLRDCSGSIIKNNVIHPGRFGIYLYRDNYFNRNDSSEVINNEISDFEDVSYQSGIYANFAYNLRAYHNTVRVAGAVSTFNYCGLYLSHPFNHKVFNNCLKSAGNGICLYLGSGSIGSTSIDYNNYSEGNGGLIYWQNKAYNSLSDLKNDVSGQNQNSYNTDPNFSSTGPLVPRSPGLNNRGKKGLTNVDLAGNIRPKSPDTIPDIGAYEYYVSPYDIDIAAIPEPIIAQSGNNTIGILLKNNGSARLDDTVYVRYQIDTNSWVLDTAIIDLKIGEIDTFRFSKKWNVSSSGSYNVCATISPVYPGDPDSLSGDTLCTTKCVGRTGTYTIDATGNGDYSTFSAAINSLSCGIAGPITFNVRPGTYNERITLTEILGSSKSNNVKFIGAGVDSVTLTYTGTSSNPATILFDDADYISFEKIRIENDGNATGVGVWFKENSNFNAIRNCVFVLDSTSTSSALIGILAANALSGTGWVLPGNGSENLTITGNEIHGGAYGIRMAGQGGTSTSDNMLIRGNLIRTAYDEGIHLSYIGSSIIRQNTVRNIRTYAGIGIRMLYCNKDTIDRNTLEAGRLGLYVYYENSFNRNSFSTISNNMISNLQDPNYQSGIYVSRAYNVNVYHNSIYTDGGVSITSYAGISMIYNNNCFVKNNSIRADNEGMVFSSYYGSVSIKSIENNNYYGEGAAKYFHDGLTFTDLSTWKQIKSKFNSGSYEGDPGYESTTNLHANGDQLNNRAQKGLGIKVDIDGDQRPFSPDKVPDIGADEYYVSPYDIDLISLDSPAVPLIGDNSIIVTLRNSGLKALDNDTIVLSYSIDQSLYQRDTVIIDSLAKNTTFTYTFSKDWSINTAKNYELCVQLDTFYKPDPDSLTKQSRCRTMCPGAKGTYTIDPSGNGDFTNFNQALNTLNCGIYGPVVFNVKNGTYSERLEIEEITGASEDFTISFIGESRSGVKISYQGAADSPAVLYLKGADYFHFENIIFENTARWNSYGLRISHAGDYNSFENCHFSIPTNANGGSAIPCYISGLGLSTVGNAGNYNSFSQCDFTGGYYGARLDGISNSSYIYGNSFDECNFLNNRYYGIYARYQGQMSLTNSYIDSIRASYIPLLLVVGSENEIRNNIIKGGRWGMYMQYENYYFRENTSVVANNMISDLGGAADIYGADFYLSYNISFAHNSINVDEGTGGAVLRYRYGSGHDIRNNALSKSTNADLFYNFSSAFSELDYNNYYKGSSSNYAFYNNASYGTLSSWQSNVNGFNQSSRDGDPGFESATNLRVKPKSSQLANWGALNTGIARDFEGDIRNPLAPDVGADEYTDLYDVGVVALQNPKTGCELSNSEPLRIYIKNLGGIDIPRGELIPYNIRIDANQYLDTLILSSDLKQGDSILASFDNNYNFSQYRSYNVKSWTDVNNDSLRTNDTLILTVKNYERPNPQFAYTNSCSNEDVEFSDSTVLVSSTVSSYSWDFGDGTNGSGADPKHEYSNIGNYMVKLIVTSAQGCVDSISKTVEVYTKPTASFTLSDLCVGDSTTFTNTSSISTTQGASFEWSFGDGNDSTGINSKHRYTSSGNYNAQLIAISADGCRDTATRTVAISPLPTAAYTASDVCEDDSVRFSNSSSIPSGFTATYNWSFGDGNSFSATSPNYKYGSIGNYKVILTATLNNGCTDVFTDSVSVFSLPQVTFSVSDACFGDSAVFTNNTTIQQDTIKSFDWRLGDGNASSVENPKHLYASTGNYSVKLIALSVNGCSDSSSSSLTINPKPTASFSVATVCEDDSSQFINNSSIPSGNISAHNWQFGDGFGSTSEDPKHLYQNPGTYSARLIVESGLGCSDTATSNAVVNARPQVDYTVTNICFGDALSPNNNSSISSGSISTWDWTFGDGNSSSNKSPSHTYTAKGTYTVKLVATSNNNCADSLEKTVKVDNVLVPGFSSVNVCNGDSMSFTNSTNTSCGTISSYLWKFGDGNSSSSKDAKHLYASAGTYSVKLIVTQQGGAKDSVTQNVVVYPNPSNSFSVSAVCTGTAASFTNNSSISSGSISSYNWSFGDGNRSSLRSPNHTYTTDGNYTVQLITVSDQGCRDTSSKQLDIYELPDPDFSASAVCLGQGVNFTNQSSISSGSLSYNWDFGDGFSSSQTSPSYTYSSAGTYTVTLTATSSNNCKSSISKNLNVNPLPDADFISRDTCTNDITRFTNKTTISSGTISYKWTFGDGNQSTSINPNHTYSSSGSYNVKLLTTSNKGCKDSITKVVQSYPTPTANFTLPASCSGTSLKFTNASTISSGTLNYQWNFGDGNSSTNTDPTHTYSSTGNYTVKLTAQSANGCTDSISRLAQVFDLPTARFASTGICESDSTYFNNTSTIASGSMSFAWDLGDGTGSSKQNPTHLYTSGTYNVKLVATSNGGCKDSSTQTITIYPAPTADFNVTDVCFGESSQFTNNSSISSGNLSYFWNFDDGNASVRTSPSNTYGSVGSYKVKLVTTSASGCSDSVFKTTRVFELPKAKFNYQSTCFGDSVQFTNSSSISSGILIFNWDFDDGNQNNSRNPKHLYSATGSYNVSLIANTTNGCSDTAVKTISINPRPDASFAFTNKCLGSSVQFNNTSSIASGSYTSAWKFGDGKTSSQKSPTHLYGSSGSYFVNLTLQSDSGCTDSALATVLIHANPTAAFSSTNICLGDSIQFNNQSSISSGSIATNKWTFGDGFSSNKLNPTHLYTGRGTYTVQLIVSSDSSCSDTISKSVSVYAAPQADFSVTNVCFGDTLSPVNSSSIAAGSISSYRWDFGDGNTSSAQNPSHYYSNKGTYTIKLVIESNRSCTDSLSKTVEVDNIVIPDFNATEVCDGVNTKFTNTTNSSCGNILYYQWNFGDGNSSSQVNPSHKYSADGSYKVQLIVTQKGGLKDTVEKTITVNPLPAVAFSLNDTCQNAGVSFNNQSSISGGSIKTYEWIFGNGDKSSNAYPSYQYANSGNYKVELWATSNKGCTDSTARLIQVHPRPEANFSAASVCLDDSTRFTNKSTSNGASGLSYSWLIDGNSYQLEEPVVKLNSSGLHQVRLVVSSNKSCRDTVVKRVRVNARPQAKFVSDSVCRGSISSFTDSSSISNGTISSYSWKFGDGFSSSLKNPGHQYSAAGNYSVQLIVRSDSACTDTMIQSAVVHAVPKASFTATNLCLGDSLKPVDNSTITNGSISSWSWDFGDGNTANVQAPAHRYTANGTYSVQLTVLSSNGCIDSTTQQLTVANQITPGFVFNDVCLGDTVAFTNTSSTSCGNISSWSWDFGDNNSSSAKDPTHVYSSAGTYTVTLIVTQQGGNRDTAIAQVEVYPVPRANFFASADCEGEQIQFSNLSTISSGSITSYVWDFDDGNKSIAKAPKHTYNAHGSFDVQLVSESNNGCLDTIVKSLSIYEVPKADFSAQDVCDGKSVSFTNNSSISSGSMNYTWDFGDGFSSSQTSPKYNYSSDGSYQVKLTVHSNNFCEDEITKTVTVFPVPQVDFTVADTCELSSVRLVNKSGIKSGTVNYRWSFGNGSTSQLKSPSPSYSTNGTYQVKLVVNSAAGCSDSTTQSINVFDLPEANFSYSSTCPGSAVDFSNNSNGGNHNLIGQLWRFSPSDSSLAENPSFTFNGSGPFDVMLGVINDKGCIDTAMRTVTFEAVPLADFSSAIACQGDSVKFTNQTSLDKGIAAYLWRFPDGSTDTRENPSHKVDSNANEIAITLVATSDQACSDSITRFINVFKKPQPDFSVANTCLGDSTQFVNLSPGLDQNTYSWEFGNGDTSTMAQPKVKYGSAGNYQVRLTANNENCTEFKSINVRIALGPEALDFDFIEVCEREFVQFTNQSQNPNLSFRWQFFDGTFSSQENPEKYYPKAGTFTVGFEAFEGECIDSIYKRIEIHRYADSTFFYQTIGSLELQFNSNDSSYFDYEWDFGDGNTSTLANPSHQYAAEGTYTVRLTVTTDNGCVNFSEQQIEVTSTGIYTPLLSEDDLSVYPNPFRDRAVIEFSLHQRSHLFMALYDQNGRLIRILHDDELNQGSYQEGLNLKEFIDNGSGMFFLRMIVEDEVITRRLIKLR